ncbi:MAG: hypothetical protein LBK99_08765 [Opitutaceae bacterium]|nr:hypothetical protein [Opitutaceae bacterium]
MVSRITGYMVIGKKMIRKKNSPVSVHINDPAFRQCYVRLRQAAPDFPSNEPYINGSPGLQARFVYAEIGHGPDIASLLSGTFRHVFPAVLID